MRTPTLQYLYLQKPVTLVVIICILSVLPWNGPGDFLMKGEPREAAVAGSMLESGNWVLPQVDADGFAYESPLAHWLIAAASLPQGYVSRFTAHLPSALAFIALISFSLLFFGKRLRFQQAFISTLLLITCVKIHQAATSTQADMLLTTLIVIGLFRLFRWEDKLELKGLPIDIPLLFGCAVLTGGPVGLVLPLFVFGVYLLALHKYSYRITFKALFYVAVSSSFLPSLWYIAAWKQGGEAFLDGTLANYFSGAAHGFVYNFGTLIIGFMPWTLFFFFSLFGMKLHNLTQTVRELLSDCRLHIRNMEKEKLFSLVALVCIFIFYSILSCKQKANLMPAYPFIAIFLAQYVLYLTEYRTKVTRLFAAFMASVTVVILIAVSLTMCGAIDPLRIASQYTDHPETLAQVQLIAQTFAHPSGLTIGLLLVLFLVLAIVFYQMSKKINIKILYATIALSFAMHLLADGMMI